MDVILDLSYSLITGLVKVSSLGNAYIANKFVYLYLDLNECRRYNECAQTCVNTVGSFYCSCWNGYELADDNRTCTGTVYMCMHNC